MNGVDGAFLPEGLITRAQLCAMACRYLGLSASGEASFDDCSGHWASGYINVLHQKGMVQGVSEGVFLPDEPVTRAQAVTLLNAVLGRKPVASKITAACPYTDLPASHWAYSDILEASVRHSKTQFH